MARGAEVASLEFDCDPARRCEEVATPRGFIRAWKLDPVRLDEVAAERAEEYRTASPFPHVVLDNLFPEQLLDDVAAEFPAPEHQGWRRYTTLMQRKLQWIDPTQLPPCPAYFVGLLQSSAFLDFLERLTGIGGLLADPHLDHGGMHQIEPGGYLKIHTDKTRFSRLAIYRRLDVIVYLNRDWDESWGGDLELWDPAMTRCEHRISPRFNRTVIFSSQADSNHGHPDPMNSPPGVNRRSMALYYYTSTENPTEASTGDHFSQMRARPGEVLDTTQRVHYLRRAGKEVLPPVVLRLVRRHRS